MTDSRKVAAFLAMGAGWAFSLTNNVLATQPDGVRVTGGVAAAVFLPVAVHLWGAVSTENTFWQWARGFVMFGIAGLAATVSWAHAFDLYTRHDEDPLVAGAIPVIVELIVVFGVLALREPTRTKGRATGHTRKGGGRQPVSAGPAGKNGGERAKAGSGADSPSSPPSPPPSGFHPTGKTTLADCKTDEEVLKLRAYWADKKAAQRAAAASENGHLVTSGDQS